MGQDPELNSCGELTGNVKHVFFFFLLTQGHLMPHTLKTNCFCMLVCEFVCADVGTRDFFSQQIKGSGTCVLPPNQI